MRRGLVIAIALAALPARARAGGYYVPEIGARGTALGAAVVADGADPAAVFHDPAELAGAGTQAEVAAGLFFPSVTFFRRPLTDPNTGANLHFDGASNTNTVIPVPFAGASYRLGERITGGLAVYAPFGATLDFPEDGAQRQIVTGIALRTIFVSPALAYELPGGFAVGAAANFIYGDLVLDQRNALPYVTGDPEQYPDPQGELQGTTHLSARDPFSVGATLGATWHTSNVRVGASVMTPVKLHMEGDADVKNPGISELTDDQGNTIQAAGERTDQIKITIPLPLIARLGIAVKPAPGWRIEADVNYQRWSTFQQLDVDFVHHYYLLQTPGAYLYNIHVATAWHDTWTARIGVEAALWERLALRAGVVYDQSPIDDRHFSLLTPDSDKLGLAAGARWAFGPFDVALAAVHFFLSERDIAPAADGSPGSDGTILNKPAPSFFHGVTRAGISVITLAVGWRH